MNALDLFAGPGGWDVGAKALGIESLGIELDEAACETRSAAGLNTLQADVAELEPIATADHARGPWDLLIASPPCQAWSMAGKRGGEADKGLVYELTDRIAQDLPLDEFVKDDLWEDPRSRLVTEPLRWIKALRPRFIALEQVPPVLDYWKHVADLLRADGYSAWAGILSAEQYGVPQTRKRAILMASLDGPVHPPLPTHQRYVPGEAQWDAPMVSLEGELRPWVSMARALGWSGRKYDRRQGNTRPDGERVMAPLRDEAEPAPTIASDGLAKGRDVWRLRAGTNEHDISRPADEPAPMIRYGERMNDVSWVEERPAPTIVTTRRSDQGIIVGRQLPEGEGRNVGGHGWTEERPATVVQGDLARPGHTGSAPGKRWQMDNAVRVTIKEAAVLQGFPPDYPWQGTRTKQFQQVGNAVSPPLAEAVLRALVGEALERREAA